MVKWPCFQCFLGYQISSVLNQQALSEQLLPTKSAPTVAFTRLFEGIIYIYIINLSKSSIRLKYILTFTMLSGVRPTCFMIINYSVLVLLVLLWHLQLFYYFLEQSDIDLK